MSIFWGKYIHTSHLGVYMKAEVDIQCAVCGAMSLEGDEYGEAWSIRTEKWEKLCILCIKSCEHIGIEVKV